MEGLQRFWIFSEIERLVVAAVDVTGARKLMQRLQLGAFRMEGLLAVSALDRVCVSPDGPLAPVA